MISDLVPDVDALLDAILTELSRNTPSSEPPHDQHIPTHPRNKEDDYTADMAGLRREFLHEQTGVSLDHVGHFSVDPSTLPGNVENFSGVAQVPIGIAGPLRINGERGTG